MKLLKSKKKPKTCFCAFCKAPRRIENQKHLSWTNVFLCGILGLSLNWVFWTEINPKSLVFFVSAMIFCEIFVQIRWRLSLVCPHCQFDPIIYLKDPDRAAQRVRKHFEYIKESPAFLFTDHPLNKKRKEAYKKAHP